MSLFRRKEKEGPTISDVIARLDRLSAELTEQISQLARINETTINTSLKNFVAQILPLLEEQRSLLADLVSLLQNLRVMGDFSDLINQQRNSILSIMESVDKIKMLFDEISNNLSSLSENSSTIVEELKKSLKELAIANENLSKYLQTCEKSFHAISQKLDEDVKRRASEFELLRKKLEEYMDEYKGLVEKYNNLLGEIKNIEGKFNK